MKKLTGLTVCKNLDVRDRLGTGSFGQIYLAVSKGSPNDTFAVKFQPVSSPHPQLFYEAKLYKMLAGTPGVPRMYAVTTEHAHNLMVLQLLGKSLQDIFQAQGKRIGVASALMAGLQMLERVKALHQKGYLHRDIKPDNFLIGLGQGAATVFMIDLGLAKHFMKAGLHISYCTGKELTGTARYASINTHMGYQQSRRDDLESIGYVLVYLTKGSLPWQNLKAHDKKSKYDLIRDRKLSTPVSALCYGLPTGLVAFITAAKNLKFEQQPQYDQFRGMLMDALRQIDAKNDFRFDWLQPKNAHTGIDHHFDSLNKTIPTENPNPFSKNSPVQRQTPAQKQAPLQKQPLPPKNKPLLAPRTTLTAKFKVIEPPLRPSGKMGSTELLKGRIKPVPSRVNSTNSRTQKEFDNKKWNGPRITVIKQ